METTYLWVKALHVISVIAWMAGMMYLPRLYVYHADKAPGSDASEMLKVMERRLLRIIINPAMVATFIFGIWLIVITGIGAPGSPKWIHAKIGLVLMLSGYHGMLAKWRKDFDRDQNTKSAGFYRKVGEIPALLMIGIVILVVVKPF